MTAEMPVALVTGGARRLGAAIVETLHAAGYRVMIHCRQSRAAAEQLAGRMNTARAGSAAVIVAELRGEDAPRVLVQGVVTTFGRLDLLVNNASSFRPTPIGDTSRAQWNELVDGNLAAPWFLSQAAAPLLRASGGCIVNLVDIHANRPLPGYAVYSTTKAGLHMLTRALAVELAPGVRVNGISPGAILWPEAGADDTARAHVIASTPLGRTGNPKDIADAVLFLARSPFITGQIIAVDGGRSV